MRHKSRGKNSSDETLRQEMRKIVDISTDGGRIVLISGQPLVVVTLPYRIRYVFICNKKFPAPIVPRICKSFLPKSPTFIDGNVENTELA